MKKNKNKKLKNQFKKLLNQQLSKNIEYLKPLPEQTEVLQEKKSNPINDSKTLFYFKKDILKTIVISFLLIAFLISLSFYFNANNNIDKTINWLANFI